MKNALIAVYEIFFHFGTNFVQTTISGIQITMKECPSLETLVIPFRKSNFTTDDGQKICPRLKFLVPSMEGLQEFFKEVANPNLNLYYQTKSLP